MLEQIAFRKVLPVQKQSMTILTDNAEKEETAQTQQKHRAQRGMAAIKANTKATTEDTMLAEPQPKNLTLMPLI